MLLPVYIGMLHGAETALADSFDQVAEAHGDEPDVLHLCQTLAGQCRSHADALRPIAHRYGEQPDDEPDRLHADALTDPRSGPLGHLRHLQDLYVRASFVDITWSLVELAGRALRDEELISVVEACDGETTIQLSWLRTRLEQAAPQALVVAS